MTIKSTIFYDILKNISTFRFGFGTLIVLFMTSTHKETLETTDILGERRRCKGEEEDGFKQFEKHLMNTNRKLSS